MVHLPRPLPPPPPMDRRKDKNCENITLAVCTMPMREVITWSLVIFSGTTRASYSLKSDSAFEGSDFISAVNVPFEFTGTKTKTEIDVCVLNDNVGRSLVLGIVLY